MRACPHPFTLRGQLMYGFENDSLNIDQMWAEHGSVATAEQLPAGVVDSADPNYWLPEGMGREPPEPVPAVPVPGEAEWTAGHVRVDKLTLDSEGFVDSGTFELGSSEWSPSSATHYLNGKLSAKGYDVECCDTCAEGRGCAEDAHSTAGKVGAPIPDKWAPTVSPTQTVAADRDWITEDDEDWWWWEEDWWWWWEDCCCCVEDLVWQSPPTFQRTAAQRAVTSAYVGRAVTAETVFFEIAASFSYRFSETTGHCSLEWWEWGSNVDPLTGAWRKWENKVGNPTVADHTLDLIKKGKKGTLTNWANTMFANGFSVGMGVCPEGSQTVLLPDIPSPPALTLRSIGADLHIVVILKSAEDCGCEIDALTLSVSISWKGWSPGKSTARYPASATKGGEKPSDRPTAPAPDPKPFHIWNWPK